MMRTRFWLLGFLGLFLGFAAIPAEAQRGVPPGSYLQSCRNARVVNGTLTAVCQNAFGGWVQAGVPLGQCGPGSDIVNSNGRLVCRGGGGPGPGWGGPGPGPGPGWGGGGGGPGWGGGPPRGSYLATCRNVNMSGGTLNATCQDARGRWRNTSLNVGRCGGRDISNANGQLICR